MSDDLELPDLDDDELVEVSTMLKIAAPMIAIGAGWLVQGFEAVGDIQQAVGEDLADDCLIGARLPFEMAETRFEHIDGLGDVHT